MVDNDGKSGIMRDYERPNTIGSLLKWGVVFALVLTIVKLEPENWSWVTVGVPIALAFGAIILLFLGQVIFEAGKRRGRES